MAQESITVKVIYLEAPDGSKIKLTADNDGYIHFGNSGKRIAK